MANQNPQPEIYTTTHQFVSGSTPGTRDTQTVFTNQNSSEEVRIYSLSVNMFTTDSGERLGGTNTDFAVRIKIGNSYVPSHEFDLNAIYNKGDKMLTFSTPLLVLFQQPISVEVSWKGGTDDNNTAIAVSVKVNLHAELSLAHLRRDE